MGQLALCATLAKAPLHAVLARAGVLAAPDPVARDARTVAFLRQLDLDPGPVLGDAVVARADAWSRTKAATAAPQVRVRSLRPIGSQMRLATP